MAKPEKVAKKAAAPVEEAPAAKPKKSIKQLLIDLAAETDPGEKRKIRAKLRNLGHTGGLGGTGGKPKAKKAKATKPADEDEDEDEDEVEAPDPDEDEDEEDDD